MHHPNDNPEEINYEWTNTDPPHPTFFSQRDLGDEQPEKPESIFDERYDDEGVPEDFD